MAYPSRPSIMEPSHVLPLRPVPKIQTMFSGLTLRCSPARDDPRSRERRDLPLFIVRRQIRLRLGVNAVPSTPSESRAGLGVIATVYSRDRKSTRLNSSHTVISYAVFCLKKKKKKKKTIKLKKKTKKKKHK